MDKILIGCCTLILGILIGVEISYFATDHPSKLENSNSKYEIQIAPGRYLKNIDFKNHSYIHLRNRWNSAGDQLLHDPECKCHNNKEL